MIRLATMLYAIVATSFAGIGVIAVLSAGANGWMPIVVASGVGFVLAIPGSIYVAKQIQANLR